MACSEIVVFGRGFLGGRLAELLPAVACSADVADALAVERALDGLRPLVVVNAAGRTGAPNIDWCESHRDETWRSNTLGALTLGRACEARGIHFVQLSTGCLFDGRSPHAEGWRESDRPAPMSFYAQTKLAAEEGLRRLGGVCILRIRMPIDEVPSPRNVITRLAGYPTVLDVANSMTLVADLARVIRHVAARRITGTFHATAPDALEHRRLLALYRERVDEAHECSYIDPEAFARSGLACVPRSTCVLSVERLLATGVGMQTVATALPSLLDGYARSSRLTSAPLTRRQ